MLLICPTLCTTHQSKSVSFVQNQDFVCDTTSDDVVLPSWLNDHGAAQCEQRNFGRAVHADRYVDGSKTRIGVEREPIDLVETTNIFPGQVGQIERAHER